MAHGLIRYGTGLTHRGNHGGTSRSAAKTSQGLEKRDDSALFIEPDQLRRALHVTWAREPIAQSGDMTEGQYGVHHREPGSGN